MTDGELNEKEEKGAIHPIIFMSSDEEIELWRWWYALTESEQKKIYMDHPEVPSNAHPYEKFKLWRTLPEWKKFKGIPVDEKLSERLRLHGLVANENFRDWSIEVEDLEHKLMVLRAFEASFQEAVEINRENFEKMQSKLAESEEKVKRFELELLGKQYCEKENRVYEARLSKSQDILKTKKIEFTESERTHKETFISLPANTREAMLEYFEMGRAVGVLNMIGWVSEALGSVVKPWNVVDFLKSLTKEQMQELLQATSIITDPLGQELIGRGCADEPEKVVR